MEGTPKGNRVQIGIFGCCNVGKSSLLNAITGQNKAVVADYRGTTTDPVVKAMEILPLGPVVLCDTAGLDDISEMGALRLEKTQSILRQSDLALIVVEPLTGITAYDKKIMSQLEEKKIPYLIVCNKQDLIGKKPLPKADIYVSSKTGHNIEELKEKIAATAPQRQGKPLVSDLVGEQELVILVVPIDEGAPKARLILPQQQVIRDLLDQHKVTMVVQPEELTAVLYYLKVPPALVVTDSQIFGKVAEILPREIKLTSFSILFARYKGFLKYAAESVLRVNSLQDEDMVLISEGCTHHRQCGDIGTIKIPKGLEKYTGKKLNFHFSSGGDFPKSLKDYKLVIHCGGCMLNQQEMFTRISQAKMEQIPMTNYGTVLSLLQGTFERSLEVFGTL